MARESPEVDATVRVDADTLVKGPLPEELTTRRYVDSKGVPYRPGGRPHLSQIDAAPQLEEFRCNPGGPVIVTACPGKDITVKGSSDPRAHVPVNSLSCEYDSPLWHGKIAIHIRGMANSKDAVFKGKKRFMQVVWQGKFKRPVDAAQYMSGQEFVKPLPPQLRRMVEVVLGIVGRVFSSSTHMFIGQHPYIVNPVLASAHVINVAKPGQEPDVDDISAIKEDMRLWDASLASNDGKPLSSDKRRKFFDIPRNLDGRTLDTEHVWTLMAWQHVLDFSSYKLSVGGMLSMDLARWLNGQPIQLMAKDMSTGEYGCCFLVWHKRLLYDCDEEVDSKNEPTLMQRAVKTLFGTSAIKSSA